MRKILFAFLVLLLSQLSYSQYLKEDKIDDFTKFHYKSTSWEKLGSNTRGVIHYSISSVDSLIFLNIKYMDGSVFSISKGDELLLKLENDSIIKTKNLSYSITTIGGGATGFNGSAAYGLNTSYDIKYTDLLLLKKYSILKVRINTSKSFIDIDIKPKYAETFKAALNLIY